jgi:polysaccharide biosynthesis protein PslG
MTSGAPAPTSRMPRRLRLPTEPARAACRMTARLVCDPRCLGALAVAWAAAVPCLADERRPAPIHGEAFLPQLFVQFKGGEDERDFAGAAGYGFDGVRIGLRWELVTQGGEDDWSYLDRATELADRHGLAVLITVRGGNPAYGPIVEHFTASVNRTEKLPAAPSSPRVRAGFARFAAAAVSRAGARHPRVDLLWEIWNEPDFSRFWPPEPDAAAAGTLVAVTCPAMRAAGAAYIVAPAFGRRESLAEPGDFLHAFAAAGGLACPDAVSMHPYWARPPETFVGEHAQIRGRGPQAGAEPPIGQLAVSEWGIPNTDGAAGEQSQAANLLRAILAGARAGLPLLSIYEWRDSGPNGHDPEHRFGLHARSGEPRLSLKYLLWLIQAARPGPWTWTEDAATGTHSASFAGEPDARTVLFWREDGRSPETDVPRACGPFQPLSRLLAIDEDSPGATILVSSVKQPSGCWQAHPR